MFIVKTPLSRRHPNARSVALDGEMSILPELFAANDAYVGQYIRGAESPRPRRQLALLACMDSRLSPVRALGLTEGDAHLIRNARGLATPDALRFLIVSQQGLGTGRS